VLGKDGKPELSGTGPSDRGHCKGALAFDLANNTAFWLFHSVPLFPMKAAFEYPPTGLKMAQTMLCIQLASADTARQIVQLIYDAHGPNVNVVSAIPAALTADDPRVRLMKNLNGSMA
jgi:deoxyribonuclease-2